MRTARHWPSGTPDTGAKNRDTKSYCAPGAVTIRPRSFSRPQDPGDRVVVRDRRRAPFLVGYDDQQVTQLTGHLYLSRLYRQRCAQAIRHRYPRLAG